jgi:ribosomal protein S18 acetylase RimI-like enzyme
MAEAPLSTPLPAPQAAGSDTLKLSIEPNPTLADLGVLERGLFQFEENRLGSPEHAHFAILLRDETGQVQGGIDGHIMWKRLFIKTAWVAAPLRGQGIGTKLMLAAEREARARHCRCLWLTALGDHACHFYERLDYKKFGELVDYVKGQSLYSLQKIIE